MSWLSVYIPLLIMGGTVGTLCFAHIYTQTGDVLAAFGSFIMGPAVSIVAAAVLFSHLN